MIAERSLQSLLPHSGPMLLIQAPYDSGEDWATSTVQIAEDGMFYRPGQGVPSWVGVEYMAQTIALYAGIRDTQHEREINIGLLLGSRRYTVKLDYFNLGTKLYIKAQEIWQDGQMAVYECTIKDHTGAEQARAELNVFKPTDSVAFFKEQKG